MRRRDIPSSCLLSRQHLQEPSHLQVKQGSGGRLKAVALVSLSSSSLTHLKLFDNSMVSEREYSDSGDEGYEETVRGDDEEDAQLANEFQGLRVSSWLNGGTGTESSEPSTLSFRTTSDAASITSDFLEHPAAYATSASKLLVQQALLVEFGALSFWES